MDLSNLTARELGRLVGMPVGSVRYYARCRGMPHRTVGSTRRPRYRFDLREVKRWMDEISGLPALTKRLT